MIDKDGSVTNRKARIMPRPMRFRRVAGMPSYMHFMPAGRGIPGKETILTVEEFEAIRLKDHEELDQNDAAKRMEISQPTFQRIYNSARKKIADSLVNGRPLRIEGGHYRLMGPGRGRGPIGRRGFGRRRGWNG